MVGDCGIGYGEEGPVFQGAPMSFYAKKGSNILGAARENGLLRCLEVA